MRRVMALLATLAMLMLSVGTVAAQSTPSQAPVDPIDGCNYYEETGHNLCDTFLAYWESNGGLPVFGYPITEEYEEENLDTGETYTVQYFERERFEYHPENAGTEYEVLLGRLGNEVLLMQGRNWHTFEKSDSSEPNYMAATGFAIAPEFIGYWSSNGLDFGEPGVSFRESLALFGYPISQAEMETNAAGDTVLTQWFERARFEFHPDNPEGQQVLLGLLGVEVLGEDPGPPPPAEPDFTVVAEGLNNPRGLAFGPDGALYVTEAGRGSSADGCILFEDPEFGDFEACYGATGSIIRLQDGTQEEVVTGMPSFADPSGMFASGPHDASVADDGTIYVVVGEGGPVDMLPEPLDFAEGFAKLLAGEADGSWRVVADVFAYEEANNPDAGTDFFTGEPEIYSNPYGVLVDGDVVLVVDAGGNSLLQVTADGTISTVATFPVQMVEAPPFLELPEGTEIPMQSVPTAVAIGPDGAYYVSELTGFPFPVGAARVWRVAPGEAPTVYADGFTSLIDLAFDADGNLYVLELASNGLLEAEQAGPDNPDAMAGALIMVAPDGSQTTVVSDGLVMPAGLAIGADGAIYVSNFGIFAGDGQVVRVDWPAAE